MTWQLLAACVDGDPDLFFQEGRETDAQMVERETAAKDACRGCPVRSDCLEDAIATRDGWAIRGGLTPHERDLLMRRRRSQGIPVPPIPPQPISHGTPAGARAHHRRGIPLCPACAQAARLDKAGHRSTSAPECATTEFEWAAP